MLVLLASGQRKTQVQNESAHKSIPSNASLEAERGLSISKPTMSVCVLFVFVGLAFHFSDMITNISTTLLCGCAF